MKVGDIIVSTYSMKWNLCNHLEIYHKNFEILIHENIINGIFLNTVFYLNMCRKESRPDFYSIEK